MAIWPKVLCDVMQMFLLERKVKKLGIRTNKNVNSFRFVEKAIQYEIERQIHEIESGNKITQETRLYDSQTNTARPMRSKEFANDYRYFQTDLLPINLDKSFIDEVMATMPEMPSEKEDLFLNLVLVYMMPNSWQLIKISRLF